MAYAPDICLNAFQAQGFTRPQPRLHFSFPAAGYFGWRNARQTLIVDCGPIAPDDLPAHGHGDVLSFELSVNGERLVVDQGVFEYIAGDKRAMSRSSAAHNTLSLEGVDQAEFFGAFRAGRRPRVAVKQWSASAEGLLLEGTHDGFSHLPGAPRHERRIEAGSNHILLKDRVQGATQRQARVSLLLHPDVEPKRCDEHSFLLTTRRGGRVEVNTSVPLGVEPAVWWPDMGVELPTTRLVAELGERGDLQTLITVVEDA